MLFGNVPAVMAHTKVLDALVSEHGFKTYEEFRRFCKGWAVSSSGSIKNGIAVMLRSLALLEARNVAVYIPYFMSILAEARARTGDLRSALALCRDAQQRAQISEEYIWLPEQHRIEGRASLPSANRRPISAPC